MHFQYVFTLKGYVRFYPCSSPIEHLRNSDMPNELNTFDFKVVGKSTKNNQYVPIIKGHAKIHETVSNN